MSLGLEVRVFQKTHLCECCKRYDANELYWCGNEFINTKKVKPVSEQNGNHFSYRGAERTDR